MNIQKYLSGAFLLVVGVCLICKSCKKGDEDPVISMKSREARLTGKWKVVKYSIGGQDALIQPENTYPCYDYSICYYSASCTSIGQMELKFEFRKDGNVNITGSSNNSIKYDYSNSYCTDQTISANEPFAYQWEWAFIYGDGNYKNKERITIESNSLLYYDYYGSDLYVFPGIYTINKLSGKAMKLEMSVNTILVQMELEKE